MPGLRREASPLGAEQTFGGNGHRAKREERIVGLGI